MLHRLIPIPSLKCGEGGVIISVNSPDASKSRLAEMGLREGKTVKMLRDGKPCLLAVDDHRFSIRSGDLDKILVELTSP